MITQSFDQETVELRNKRTRSPGFFVDPKKEIKRSQKISVDPQVGRQVSARIFPNGEFGVGFIPQQGMSAQDRRYERDRRYAEDNAEMQVKVELDDDNNIIFYGREKVPAFPPPKLGVGSKSSQVSVRYGLKGITSYGRKMLRNAGHLMDKAVENQYNRKLGMGTVTVPSYNEESLANICRHWGDIQRRFFQECKRQYGRFRYRFDYAAATEIQPKRLENRGEVGLHIHFLFITIRLGRGRWCLSHSWVRKTWQRILESYLVNDCGGQLPNYKFDVVTKSGAAYIAKYVSKGGGDCERVVREFGEEYLPKQWWSISSVLKSAIHSFTIRSQGEVAEKLLVISRWGVSDYIKYIRCITIQVNLNEYAIAHDCPSEVVLGYGGLLSSIGYGLFSPGNQTESIQRHLPRTLDKTKRN